MNADLTFNEIATDLLVQRFRGPAADSPGSRRPAGKRGMSLGGWHAGIGSARSIASDAARVTRYTDVSGNGWQRTLQGKHSGLDSTKAKGPVYSREPSATRRQRQQQWSRLTLGRQASTRETKLQEIKYRSSLTIYNLLSLE
ncbi:hypothetical protein E2C01_017137 [Portunus trituberculatus]|uniref:Uncharacterized protein n=1 Tax=Portunus trituberculatus TaxID=210409 RepID=A0A5B7DS39_PORTR|nr:hypothetical protein [Portunus trituberculatus]